jgi:hypothetical protein
MRRVKHQAPSGRARGRFPGTQPSCKLAERVCLLQPVIPGRSQLYRPVTPEVTGSIPGPTAEETQNRCLFRQRRCERGAITAQSNRVEQRSTRRAKSAQPCRFCRSLSGDVWCRDGFASRRSPVRSRYAPLEKPAGNGGFPLVAVFASGVGRSPLETVSETSGRELGQAHTSGRPLAARRDQPRSRQQQKSPVSGDVAPQDLALSVPTPAPGRAPSKLSHTIASMSGGPTRCPDSSPSSWAGGRATSPARRSTWRAAWASTSDGPVGQRMWQT